MAIRNILNIPDDLLRKKSREVVDFNKRLFDLLDDMAETMRQADGVGLAAPQVGVLKRLAIVDVGDGIIELINPVIISRKGEQINQEGCLSCVGENGFVKRPAKVKVQAFNRYGEKYVIEGNELLARALCHEIDHLDGILFIDKIVEQPESSAKKVKVRKKN
jgi:peptide deformylase